MHLTSPIILTESFTPSDVADIAQVRWSALRTSELSILRFGKLTYEEAIPWITKSTELELTGEFKVPRIASNSPNFEVPGGEHLVVRDQDLAPYPSDNATNHTNSDNHEGRIVSHAEWLYNPHNTPEITEETLPTTEGAHPANPPPPGCNTDLIRHFNDLVETTMTEFKNGVACYELRNISTANSHLRKGIAKQLVNWIFQYADRDQLPVILAASPVGYYLYRSCGFEDATDANGEPRCCTIDMGEFGGEGIHQHKLMVRWPTNWDGPRDWNAFKSAKSKANQTAATAA
jgi:hypothetical protein